MDAVKELFARNVSRLRKEAGITQSDLSIKLGYARNAVSRWESGELLPRAESLEKLAKFFNVPKSVFFAEGGLDQYASYGKMLNLPVVSSISYDKNKHLLIYDHIESYEFISDVNLQGCGEYFFFRALCDCILGRIIAGDLLLIHQQDEISNGDIFLALINNNLILRRLFRDGTSLNLYSKGNKWSRITIENYFTDDENVFIREGDTCRCLSEISQVDRVIIIGRAVKIIASI